MNTYVILVCLYGIRHAVRGQIEARGYDSYLEDIARDVVTLANDAPVVVVLCGGKTDKRVPQLSESGTVKPFFMKHVEIVSRCTRPQYQLCVITEERSFNTAQNLFNGVVRGREHIIDSETWANAEFIVVCDTPRIWKLFILTWLILKRYLHLKNKWAVEAYDREDIHPNSRWWKQTLGAFLYLIWPKKLEQDLAVSQPRV